MLLNWINDFEMPSWHLWVASAAGLSASLMALLVGRHLVLSRRRAPVEPVESKKSTAVHDPFEHGSITECRAAVRRKGNAVEILVTNAEASQEPRRAWLLDRSMGGVCLRLSEECASGTILSIKPRKAPPATPWVQVEVRSSKEEEDGYETGCKFVRTPPWAVLLLFG